jgi:hypothetical protein
MLFKQISKKYKCQNDTPSSSAIAELVPINVSDNYRMALTFRVLYVFIVLTQDRRRVVHFNVTENPTALWTAQQIVEAFPWDTAPKYLLRDNDQIYSLIFSRRVKGMDIKETKTAYGSPWQNPFCERVIGSIRRDCLDHIVIVNEASSAESVGRFWFWEISESMK